MSVLKLFEQACKTNDTTYLSNFKQNIKPIMKTYLVDCLKIIYDTKLQYPDLMKYLLTGIKIPTSRKYRSYTCNESALFNIFIEHDDIISLKLIYDLDEKKSIENLQYNTYVTERCITFKSIKILKFLCDNGNNFIFTVPYDGFDTDYIKHIAEQTDITIIAFLFNNYYQMLDSYYMRYLFVKILKADNINALIYLFEHDYENKLLDVLYFKFSEFTGDKCVKYILTTSIINSVTFHTWYLLCVNNLPHVCKYITDDPVFRKRLDGKLLFALSDTLRTNLGVVVKFENILYDLDIVKVITISCSNEIKLRMLKLCLENTSYEKYIQVILYLIHELRECTDDMYDILYKYGIQHHSRHILLSIKKYSPEVKIFKEYDDKIHILSKILPNDVAYNIMKFID